LFVIPSTTERFVNGYHGEPMLRGGTNGFAVSKKLSACSPSRVFPPQGIWEKEHGRFDRRRIARVAVSPEDIGLCGCWQVVAVERYSQDQNKPKESASLEIGCYATSLSVKEHDDAMMLALIRGHWSAIVPHSSLPLPLPFRYRPPCLNPPVSIHASCPWCQWPQPWLLSRDPISPSHG
jgi:hypothetical protein